MRCFEDSARNERRTLRKSRASDDDSRSRNGNADKEHGDRRESGSTAVFDSPHDARPFAHETTVAPHAQPRGTSHPLGAVL